MRPNAKHLAMRDPALAALMGVLPSSDFGSEWGWEDNMGWEDFGADPVAGTAPIAGPVPPPASQAQLMQVWQQAHAQRSSDAKRMALLYPNKNSRIKVEGYQFALSFDLTLGTAATVTMSDRPDVELRPRRVTMNAPAPGFVTFTQLQVGNVNTLVGGTSDAFFYSANAQDQGVSYPTLSPSTKASFTGAYTGQVPPGFPPASAYLFSVEFKGPANITA